METNIKEDYNGSFSQVKENDIKNSSDIKSVSVFPIIEDQPNKEPAALEKSINDLIYASTDSASPLPEVRKVSDEREDDALFISKNGTDALFGCDEGSNVNVNNVNINSEDEDSYESIQNIADILEEKYHPKIPDQPNKEPAALEKSINDLIYASTDSASPLPEVRKVSDEREDDALFISKNGTDALFGCDEGSNVNVNNVNINSEDEDSYESIQNIAKNLEGKYKEPEGKSIPFSYLSERLYTLPPEKTNQANSMNTGETWWISDSPLDSVKFSDNTNPKTFSVSRSGLKEKNTSASFKLDSQNQTDSNSFQEKKNSDVFLSETDSSMPPKSLEIDFQKPFKSNQNAHHKFEDYFTIGLIETATQINVLSDSIARKNLDPDFGEKADKIKKNMDQKFAGYLKKFYKLDYGHDVFISKIFAIKMLVDAGLELMFYKQIDHVKELAIQKFKFELDDEKTHSEFSYYSVDNFFVDTAEKLLSKSHEWSYQNHRTVLKREMLDLSKGKKLLIAEKLKSGEQQAYSFQLLQQQQAQLHSIQQQQNGGASTLWNIGIAYRPPDSIFNISAGYQQGKANIQVTMIPDEQAGLLGSTGFTSGVGPGNLGVSLNLNI